MYKKKVMSIRLAVIILSIVNFSCNSSREKTTPVIENITEAVYASGVVKAGNQYQVFSTVNGLIRQILVKEGDSVKTGQPLIILTNETALLNADNAKLVAGYNAVSTNLEKLNELKLNIDLARSKCVD